MHNKLAKFLVVLCGVSTLQGCSVLVSMAFYNNSNEHVEVCNLNLNTPDCRVVAPNELAKILLVSDGEAEKWQFSISREGKRQLYEFEFVPYFEYSSEIYCEGWLQKNCNVPLQYEANGRVYWGGKHSELPVAKHPEQPKGFPVEPSA